MTIIDKHENPKEKFVNLPKGTVFKVNNQYYIKTEAMFLYTDIDCLLDNYNIYDIDLVELECQIINAICLNDFATHYNFPDDYFVEPVKTELHIV